ncbi:hypothetical protein PI124_g20364 [Phytophthora idaei]|nr:hypothetical protein PI126_g20306 [Phytophthora idaei]KAG3234584.1 hypothetical protein PI124_g20364 [Phytophthora idaei]
MDVEWSLSALKTLDTELDMVMDITSVTSVQDVLNITKRSNAKRGLTVTYKTFEIYVNNVMTTKINAASVAKDLPPLW